MLKSKVKDRIVFGNMVAIEVGPRIDDRQNEVVALPVYMYFYHSARP